MSEALRGYWDASYPPSVLNPPPPLIPATGATAGIPGFFTPPGSVPPADVAGMAGIVATPATPWTAGQYVQTGTAGAAGRTSWSGTDWVGGVAPAADPEPEVLEQPVQEPQARPARRRKTTK